MVESWLILVGDIYYHILQHVNKSSRNDYVTKGGNRHITALVSNKEKGKKKS
jgi:hypothetical protein